MSKTVFQSLVILWGAAFAVAFLIIIVPPLTESKDIIGAFAAGFVNPYSTGYSLDAIFCGLVLVTWVFYERHTLNIKHGWVALPLSFVPGVATAFAVYLVIRYKQISDG